MLSVNAGSIKGIMENQVRQIRRRRLFVCNFRSSRGADEMSSTLARGRMKMRLEVERARGAPSTAVHGYPEFRDRL